MNDNKVFAECLSALFDENKNIQRKNWATLLGVSEAAISQWVKGKTIPDHNKLRVIISIARKHPENEKYSDVLNRFIAALEYLPSDKGLTAPKYRYKKLSDYAIKELRVELDNSISLLFYDLKVELLNQYLREIEILKTSLKKHILNTNDNCDSQDETFFHTDIVQLKNLQKQFSKQENVDYLTKYTSFVKKLHRAYDLSLKEMLEQFDADVNQEREFKCQFIANKNWESINAIDSVEHLKYTTQFADNKLMNYDGRNQHDSNLRIAKDVVPKKKFTPFPIDPSFCVDHNHRLKEIGDVIAFIFPSDQTETLQRSMFHYGLNWRMNLPAQNAVQQAFNPSNVVDCVQQKMINEDVLTSPSCL